MILFSRLSGSLWVCRLYVGYFAFIFYLRAIIEQSSAAYLLGGYICVGVFATIAFQSIVNIGMNLGILPVIGVTLPFFSYGGTSVTTLYMGIGLALSVYIHNKDHLFLDD